MQEIGSTECIFNVSKKIKSNKVYWHLAAILLISRFLSPPAVLQRDCLVLAAGGLWFKPDTDVVG